MFKASSAGFLDLIAAGEVAGSFVVFRNQVAVMKSAARRSNGFRSTWRRPTPAVRQSLPTRPIPMRRCSSPILSSAPTGKS